ncbi:hypothetical protein NQ317_007456, partial [Molorchus minor]
QFCNNLANLILLICDLNKELKGKLEKGNRDTSLLYLSQLITSLSLLINIFVQESDIYETLTGARLCAKRRITWCLDGIQETLTTNKSILDPSGNFIRWMDSALDSIAKIELDKDKDILLGICNDTRVLFEEVLSHAMSIAQVALEEDCKIIRGSSQTVLDSLDSLTKEINKINLNPSMVNLFVDVCTDKLCILERRVNTAVLRLSLKVFSEYTVALEAIHDFCFIEENQGNTEELDLLVADFDLHVDRIMQIGLFAVSCSTCRGLSFDSDMLGIKIRSCLASLEALECELVPAFTAVLLDPSVPNINLALLLKRHWIQQANILRQLIYVIIDPFAFCQVVIYEENKESVDDISDSVKAKGWLEKESVRVLVGKASVFTGLYGSYSEEFGNINNSEKPTTKNAFLDHIINRGKQILKDRSILYKTSLKNDTFNIPISAFKRTQLKGR